MSSDFNLAALSPRLADLNSLGPFWPPAPEPPLDELRKSIETLGLLKPLLAFEIDGELKLMAGHRRVAALKALGRTGAPVLIPPADISQERVLALALADNLERGWNEAEKALYWRFLEDRDPDSASHLAAYLDLPPSPKLRLWCRQAAALPAAGLAALAEGRLDLENGARLAVWPREDLTALLPLFEALAPSKQKKREWLDWLEDIGRREKLSVRQILTDPEISGLMNEVDRLGRPAAENLIRRKLWTRRHPLLAGLRDRREARRKSLILPPAIQLELDHSLEDLNFCLRFDFSTLEEFGRQAGELRRLDQNPNFRALVDDTGDEINDL